ncbi:MAG: cysteine hydrolase [Coriobacteriales bacterium]|jgi:nicotinamidase-related amidase|nr:cysteine hydrolase [Coriobacteriales bacterium]
MEKPQDFLVVVDMQVDFVSGALGTPEARAIVPAVCAKIRAWPGRLALTMDTHGADYLKTQEGHYLPIEHCVKDQPGWQLVPEIAAELAKRRTDLAASPASLSSEQRFAKRTFGSVELAQYLTTEHARQPIDVIELVGLCTDLCVISNALLLKAYLPEVPLRVDASCCAGATPKGHQTALAALKVCQVEVF